MLVLLFPQCPLWELMSSMLFSMSEGGVGSAKNECGERYDLGIV